MPQAQPLKKKRKERKERKKERKLVWDSDTTFKIKIQILIKSEVSGITLPGFVSWDLLLGLGGLGGAASATCGSLQARYQTSTAPATQATAVTMPNP